MATSRISPSRPSIRLSPIHSRQNSRSTSPERNQNSLYQKIDPLLSNLSPESTLHALTSTEAVPSNGNFSHNVLSQSISQVSPAERALGIRAAIAAQNLDIWYKEVQSWTWPKQNEAKAGKGFIPPVESSLRYNTAESDLPLLPGSHGEPEFYGSLPATLVEEYEKRIDEIRDGMDNLNVDELKEHVLSAHIPSRSRPSSSTSTVSVPPPLSYVQLSDFTAIVTATILRALPLLSRLNSLLITWDVRLLVLRQIPGLLRELSSTRASLNSSFRELRSSYPSQSINTILPGSYLRAEHVKLETAVVTVGRRMDRALDALEGRLDSLPESWIDDLESIESDFAAWVVESERYQLRAEWLPVKEQSKQPVLSESGLLQPEVPSEAIDNVPALPQAATEVTPEPQMETIEEETEHDLQSSAIGSVEEVVKTVDSRTHATEKGFDTHTSSSPQCVQGPGYSEQPHRIEDSRPLSQLQFNTLVVEDVQTPTHTDSLLAQEAVVSEQSSATGSLPHAMPVIENKENIPPPSYKQERPRSSSTRDPSSKPMVLAEHNAEDDPFVQTSVEFQAKEPPASSTSVDKLDKHREHTGISSELNNIRDEYVDSKAPITQNSEPSVSSPAVNEMVPAAEMITVHEIAGQESLEKPGLDNVSSRDASSSPSFLDEQDPVTSSTLYTPKESDTMSALSGKTQTIASNAQGDQRIPSSGVINPATSANDQNDCLSQTPAKGHSVANHDPPLQVTSPVVSTESATKTSPNLVHEAAEICPSIPSDFRKSNHMEPDPTPVTIRKAEEKGPEPPTSSRKPLQSPIKLSKGRPGKLDLDKTSHIHHHRRSSTGSVGSLLSDNSSLISSPEIPAFKTGESSGHPL
ncbi:hypothetical protein N7462_010419 [Penicillium macrosclerotiorum]|uniref:uncharacterized protein n=1 Tax=Penicillium macrosclerotiorum TaxID=303699 RepID=UPI0025470C46|nr:uncharacterized protein N7462_010419 [Penicillium macrosclerotiorum]KAJ5669349.1 hypothetical protein N7462_010419 [Penicillium macrosclerotiorum]